MASARGGAAEGFPRAVVHQGSNIVKPGLAGVAEVRALWHELAQQAVRILVRVALPGGVGIAEPDVDLKPPSQFGMAGHLGPAVVGHALAQGCGQTFHLPGEAVQRRLCTVAVHFAQNNEAVLALDQRAHRRPVEGALAQIAFPMTGYQPRCDLLGTVDNA